MVSSSASKKLEDPNLSQSVFTINATPENFEDLIKNNSIVVVDFWAPWCRPCLKVAKTIDSISYKYSSTILFVKVNVDLYPNITDQFDLFTIPYFRAYKNGKFVGHFVGNVSKRKLITAFDKLVALND